MTLRDGYGVLIGTLQKYYCDRKRDDREYYHCNIRVRSRGKLFLCPVDLDSKNDANGIQWRVLHLESEALGQVAGYEEGWHPLESRKGTGALDYYRSDAFRPANESLLPGYDIPVVQEDKEVPLPFPSWKQGRGVDAFADLEPLLEDSRKLYIYGERFRVGHGVHNIHQNQGDPPSSRWYAENGTWQDGGVAVQRRDGSVSAFLCKFKTQKFFPPVPDGTV
ncbi:MAG: YukJ family protein [Chlorobiaceae bacterium]|nr:YukJ family protein [Chlorobiaceae bacterium]NTV59685.1 YukJ family protein [Chlorobiaceae bacterium]